MTRRIALLVWTSTLAMPLLFLAVAQSLRAPAPRADPALFWVALGSSVLFLALALLLPRRLGGPRAGPEATAMLRLTVGWAFCEAAALLPLVAWIVTGDARLLPIYAVALLVLAAGFPSEARWASHLPAPPPVGRR